MLMFGRGGIDPWKGVPEVRDGKTCKDRKSVV